MTRKMRDIESKGYTVRLASRTITCTEIERGEPFCLLWEQGNLSGTLSPSDDLGDGRHRIVMSGGFTDDMDVAFDALTDAEVRERGLVVPARRVWTGKGFQLVEPRTEHDPVLHDAAGKVLFEDISFTVKDHGSLGVAITFVGKDVGEEVSGTKWFTDGAAEQVREFCERPTTALPDRLSKLTGIDREWQTLDLGHTQWIREGADFMVYATRIKGEDGADEWWVQTWDDNRDPVGPRETAEVFDVEGARLEGRKLANLPSSVAVPGR